MRRILIVDDEPDVLQSLKSSLERQGDFTVAVAKDGQEALKKLESEAPPDLIVLDLVMPTINGEEVLKSIRKNFKTVDVPVIISTVKRETSSLINLMNLGATDYLMKPYDVKELTRLINSYT
ncbi:MAG: response regulator [Candidatus Omnitrophota bacterium]